MKNRMTNITRFGAVLSVLTLAACGGGTETKTDINVVNPTTPVDDWRLVWSDEFDGNAINTDNWTHEVNCLGGGNQERQCYTDSAENSFVSDGMLKIVAKTAPEGAEQPYTSARMTTQNKVDIKYGRIEMRAKLPAGQGSWPAFWMMPTDSVYGGWPKSGEVDIMEAVNLGTARADGSAEKNIYGTIHYGAGPGSDFSGAAHTPSTSPAESFNTYAIEWQEGEIRWYFNNVLYATQRQSEVRTTADGTVLGLSHRGWYAELYDVATGQLGTDYSSAPFDQDFFMILNVAVGGSWPESVNAGGVDASAFAEGQTLEVDYVRVYQCSADPVTGRGCETVSPGYDIDVADGGKLVEGRAPAPSLVAGAPNPITIFDDAVDVNWVAWDCCGGSTPGLVADDADRGEVYEFAVENGNEGTVFGFITRSAFLPSDPTSPSRPAPHNALGMIDGGYVTFDLKVTSAPTSPDAVWKFKIEADEQAGGAWEADLTTFGAAPVVGQWSTYRVPLQDIADNGVDISLLDVIMVFPAWQTGEGAVFRMDNVAIAQDTAGVSYPEFPVSTNENWALWDCCGGSTPELVNDAEKGQVAEFSVLNGNSGTVLGWNARTTDGGTGVTLNVAEIASNGVLSFDLKVVNAPAAGNEAWLLKVESGGATGATEVNLNTSAEGVDPSDAWQTFTFPIADLMDRGSIDPSDLDVIMLFPAWGTGADSVYRVANVKFHVPGSGAAAVEPLATFIDAGAVNVNWALWDCCGGSTPEFVNDDTNGQVAQFSVLNGNSGTVLGLNSRTTDGGTGISVDATSLLATGVFRFDLKVINAPAAGNEAWLLKIESGGAAGAVEINLNTSNEGVNPSDAWQTFTFNLVDLLDAGTLDPSDIDVIMVFPAWGTGADAVFRIDNMEIIDGSAAPSTPSNGGNTGGETEEPAEPEVPEPVVYAIGQEIIVDGSFDSTESTAWTAGTVTAEGDNNTLVSQVSSAGDPWSVNVSQVLTLDPATNYTLTFKAKATEARNIIAGIGQNAAPYYSDTEVVALTTDWAEYTLHVASVDVTTGEAFGDANSRVLFDLGAEVGDVSLDDISLAKSTQLVVNGGFDNSTNFWNAGVTAADGENNYFTADVAEAGDPWSVNLSQVLTLVPSKSYEVTFKARATQARTMIAGLGLNAAPYHSSTETVALTTEWQTFTYTFVTNDDTTGTPYGDDNSRVLFDMGADVGTVHIDDVTVTALSGELLVNRGFDDGNTNWNGGEIVTDGDNSYFTANVATAGDPWSVNLSQVTTLVPSADYVLTFKAKGTADRTMIAGIGLNAAPYHSSTNVVTLTAEWTTYTYLLSAIDDTTGTPYGDDNSRVLFDMGADVGEVSLDDVSLVPVSAFNQLVTNHDFSQDITGWNAGTVVSDGDNDVYQADVTAAGDPWSVNLSQVLTLVPSNEYVMTFKAKSSIERTMIAGIGLNAAPYHSSTAIVGLTTEWQTFTYTLIANDDTTGTPYGDDNSRVLFDMGAEVGLVSIDDVKLFERK
jgi:beta-glucanase (GH16 family)